MPAKTTAFLGTYPPRLCGIATFTRDLAQAVADADPQVGTTIIAVRGKTELQPISESVGFEIRKTVKDDYVSAADFVNYSNIRLVSLQHEYGIFGGDDGGHILDFLARIHVPSIATLHTVLKEPSQTQRAIVKEMSQRCNRLVVMSEIGRSLLNESYQVPTEKIIVIPHGIPDLPQDEMVNQKERFGVAGRRLLMTFGLLSPNKGIETVIRALPRLVNRFPDLLYFVVGATHPEVKREHGEEYRHSLEREAHALDVADHVVFRNQFVTLEELCAYLQATDIYVTPYRNQAQSTSGTLAYAMGAGAAVVSTPYWHAQELLADGRGRLFDAGDVDAFGTAIDSLLSNDAELQSIRAKAYQFTRPMTWRRIGKAYADLANQVVHEVAAVVGGERVISPNAAQIRQKSLPEPSLDHLLRLTDDTGIIQHATFTVPSRRTGYCVDDNARALLVVLLAHRVTGSLEAKRLITLYLSFLNYCQHDDGRFHNFVDYNRVIESGIGSEDCMGRAIWALGATTWMAPDHGTRQLAREMLKLALGQPLEFGPRGQALVIMGLEALLRAEPGNSDVRAAISARAEYLCQRFEHEADGQWKWFEPTLTYDNAFLPQALFLAFGVTRVPRTLQVAIESLSFLERVCFAPSVGSLDSSGKYLALVGNQGWHERSGEKPVADEQPIDAAAFVLAFRSAYMVTGDGRYLSRMRLSFDWFLGANRLNARLYDFSTGGCCDGLGEREASQNQGAESTISFLLSLLTMLDIGEPHMSQGVEAPARPFARTRREDVPEVVTLKNENDWPVGKRSGHPALKRPK